MKEIKKQKSTKSALITSVLSLVLCMSMLIGTTFAWFTDSVTSRNNIIKSGNLDIVFEMGVLKEDAEKATEGDYAGYYDPDDYDWVEIQDDTEIFSDEDLWEPGRVQTAVLRVRNAGTLALKYALSTNVYLEKEGTNVYGETFKLSDYLDVAFVKGVVDVGSRNAAKLYIDMADKLGAVAGDLKDISTEGTLLEKDEFMYYTMVVAMPETVGNEANYKTGTTAPYISFGVDLYATQYTYEEDSFGKDYDEGAEYEIAPVADVSILDLEGPISATAGMNGTKIEGGLNLDAAFRFKTTESSEEAKVSDYKYWHADFVVTADEAVKDGTIALAGYYEAYCKDYNDDNWVALINDGMPVEADQEIRLLQLMLSGGSMSYQELCQWVPTFDCGLADLDGSNEGTTITVELRLYEVTDNTASTQNETGKYITVGTYSYTF